MHSRALLLVNTRLLRHVRRHVRARACRSSRTRVQTKTSNSKFTGNSRTRAHPHVQRDFACACTFACPNAHTNMHTRTYTHARAHTNTNHVPHAHTHIHTQNAFSPHTYLMQTGDNRIMPSQQFVFCSYRSPQ